MAFTAPKTLPELPPEATRAILKAFSDLEATLRRPEGAYVDRRNPAAAAKPQADQVVHVGADRRLALPDPRPYLARTLTVVVESGPVTLLGTINRDPELELPSKGAFILVSTGDSWWSVGGSSAGSRGETGATGLQGAPGATGAKGASSPPGEPGEAGEQGLPGKDGQPGQTGLQGPPGGQGEPGDPGEQGPPGQRGDKGDPGASGLPGADGADGDPGPPGVPGATGVDGAPGAKGDPGPPGIDGADGDPGPPGAQGPIGPQGPAGADGSSTGSGLQGPPGEPGSDGDQGPPGIQGQIGPQGIPGLGIPGDPGDQGEPGFIIQQQIVTTQVGGVGFISTQTVNLGTIYSFSGTFDLVGLVGLTPGDPVFVARAVTAVTPDEAEDQMVISGRVLNSTTIRCFWKSPESPVAGSIFIQFAVASSTGALVGTGANFYQLGREDSDMTGAVAPLIVVPMFNWSRDAVAHVTEFDGPLWQPPFGGFTPSGRMQVHKIPSEVGHPGIIRCIVPLGQTGSLFMGASSLEPIWEPATLLGFRCIIRLNTVNPGTDYDVHLGFNDNTTSGGDLNAIGWTTGATALWVAYTANGGAFTTDNDDAIVAGNWFVLEQVKTATGWLGYINGVANNATITTNIPTALLNFGIRLADDGGGAVDFSIDIDSITIFTGTLPQRWTT